MRTQFFYVGLLGAIAGGLVGTAGCDDITAGQSADSSAPPQLVHVMIQDARYLFGFPNRASALDILDNNNTRTCQITDAQAGLDTCINEFLVDQVAPDVACQESTGTCKDPLKIPATGVPVPLSCVLVGIQAPDNRDPGGGIQVRLVFDKVLDSALEMVTMDPTKAPGTTNTYVLEPGLIELDDQDGNVVASKMYLDNGGSPEFSSDLELVPLGPALVIKPTDSLLAATTYTVKILKPGDLKDRQGNAAVALGGGALATSYTFKTEDLTPDVAGAVGGGLDYPDFSDPTAPPTITPNEVIQIGFFELPAGDSATVTVTGPTGAAPVVAYSERLDDPTMCSKFMAGADPSFIPILDITAATTNDLATAMPAEWTAGDYMIHVSVKDITGRSAAFEADYAFTVDPAGETTDPMMDPNIQSAHRLPAECQM